MALRNQPYIQFYVNDFLTDEKLNECSAEATGVYIKLLCVLHKEPEYGVMKLESYNKRGKNPVSNFAAKLSKHMSFDMRVIKKALNELLLKGVINIDGDKLSQKRMVEDGEKSLQKAENGAKGGRGNKLICKPEGEANTKAKLKQNPEIVFVYDAPKNDEEINMSKGAAEIENTDAVVGPSYEEVKQYCDENRVKNVNPIEFCDYYRVHRWRSTRGFKITDWRAMVNVWAARNKPAEFMAEYEDYLKWVKRRYDLEKADKAFYAKKAAESVN